MKISRIAVLGCGAMGSVYAALLSRAGYDVMAVDANAEHVDAINRNGLRVTGASGDTTVHIPAYVNAPAEHVDLIILAVKARHVPTAAAQAAELCRQSTKLLTIQNGLGSADIVADALGAGRLMVGVAQGFGASLPEPGHAHHNAMKAIRIGLYAPVDQADLQPDDVEQIAALWRDAGFDVEAVSDIASMQWGKLICNVAYSAACAITGMTVGQVRDDAEMGQVSRAAAREAFEVAQAAGMELAFDDPEAEVCEFAARMPDAKPSVLLDLEAGRPSEVDVINGAVVRKAEQLGMSAPVNATLTALVKTLEQRGVAAG